MYLRTDQYTHVKRDCPMSIEMYPVDDIVEIALGEYRVGGDMLRLIVDHPDTCLRLVDALHDARNRLAEHLRVKSRREPALSTL